MSTIFSSQELQVVVKHAKGLAKDHSRPLTSLHLVISMFSTSPNYCGTILRQMKVSLEGKKGLRDAAVRLKEKARAARLEEPDDTLKVMHEKACKLAHNRGAETVNSLFYLLAICRLRKSLAFRVLTEAGADLSALRTSLQGKVSSLPTSETLRRSREGEEQGSETTVAVPAVTKSTPAAPAAEPAVAEVTPGQTGTEPSLPAAEPPGEPTGYELDSEEFPLLTRLAVNITARAARGKVDPVIGRTKELEQVIQVLRKRKSNNPCLIGEPGVGKTALVEGLAQEILENTPRARWLQGRIILQLGIGSLVAGTQLRGSFSEKMIEIREEVRNAAGRVIIFFDEIHAIVGAGGGDTALDAANELKTSLAAGEFPSIGATTLAEYKKYIEQDDALARRFQRVYVNEPTIDEAREILKGIIGSYEKHHNLKYSARAIDAAVRLSDRFVTDRFLPGKAVDLIDWAGSMAATEGRDEVGEEHVARVLSRDLDIPIERMLLHSSSRFKEMEDFLKERVVGHRAPLKRVCEAVKRGIAGFSSNRPLASFLFVGPAGTGRSQTARALASFLFDSEEAIVLFQMSEFTERHSIGKLIGTAPGYVGHEEGGRLTEAIRRRPFRIILFKDVLAAHPDVQDLIAEVINRGSITDGKGRRCYLSNAVVIATQTVEPEQFANGGDSRRVGFAPAAKDGAAGPSPDKLLKELERKFSGSLFGAPDERLVFYPLSGEQVVEVARLEAAAASRQLKDERNVSFELADGAVTFLIERGGFTAEGGAQLMQQTLARTVLSFLADRMLAHEVVEGNHVVVDCDGDELSYDIS